MTIWGNPPKFVPVAQTSAKKVTPEALAKSGSEDGHQAALFCWAADSVGKYPQLAWLFAIPNGGQRHIAEATKFVATGLRKGVPDVFLPCPLYTSVIPDETNPLGRGIMYSAGCFIEMKVKKNKISKEQDEWIAYLKSAGYAVAVCYSWIEARDTLIAYLEGKL